MSPASRRTTTHRPAGRTLRRDPSRAPVGRRVTARPVAPRSARAAVLLCTLLWTACASPSFEPRAFTPLPDPAPADVAAVLFLLGDAGQATTRTSPLLHALRADVERWAGALGHAQAVTVLFLGDNVYPVGLHPPGTPDFPADSTRLAAQAWTVSGPEARRFGARGVFVPGNHDWVGGGAEGLARLRAQQRLVSALGAKGPSLEYLPRPGAIGPSTLTLGARARVLVLDTEAWLRADDDQVRRAATRELANALGEAGDKTVVLAAHHPLVTAGPHGGAHGRFDLVWPLRRMLGLTEDLNSDAYERMRAEMSQAFGRSGPPLVYAAGHDHSLQVIRGTDGDAPRWSLVSGAGSKTTRVGATGGTLYAAARPGYMRLVFLRSGRVDLFVLAAPRKFERCGGSEGNREACMRRGSAAFGPVYSVRLR